MFYSRAFTSLTETKAKKDTLTSGTLIAKVPHVVAVVVPLIGSYTIWLLGVYPSIHRQDFNEVIYGQT